MTESYGYDGGGYDDSYDHADGYETDSALVDYAEGLRGEQAEVEDKQVVLINNQIEALEKKLLHELSDEACEFLGDLALAQGGKIDIEALYKQAYGELPDLESRAGRDDYQVKRLQEMEENGEGIQ